jgi:hypothetical protein
MTAADRTRETRLRRMAERQGLRLERSRRRDPRAIGYGTYQLVDSASHTIAAGDTNNGYGLTLDDVEHALTGSPMDDERRRWLKENLPSGTGIVRVDAKAIEAWIARNPGATAEDLLQIVRAPDHFLELITREGEEDWQEKGQD